MDLEIRWHAPFSLREATDDEDLIYVCDQLDQVTEKHGVYFFGRKFGDDIAPIYIGRAKDIRKRIGQHLTSNVRLMKAIQKARNGERVLLTGEWIAKKGQQEGRVLQLIEAALIKFALAEGHEIVNDKGTKTSVHTLSMKGNRAPATKVFRSTMKIEQR
ncbi:MAG TPA: hypothetical protein VGI39_18355 [Polyangiaceae bacterium]